MERSFWGEVMSDRKQHKHYQAIRAYADGWDIEVKHWGSDKWSSASGPYFEKRNEYRIVPDEDGWIPWYGGDKPPIDGLVDLKFLDKNVSNGRQSENLEWAKRGWAGDIIAYRPHKEIKKETQKVKMWQWLIQHIDTGQVHITDTFYAAAPPSLDEDYKVLSPALWSEIEVQS
jgi:hypothetical protein